MVKERVDAKKNRIGTEEALALARSAKRVLIARGKKYVDYDMKKSAPGDDELVKGIMGPSGNLRAPTLRIGQTVVVGYHDEVYSEVMGC